MLLGFPCMPLVISQLDREGVSMYHILLPADMDERRTEAQAEYVLDLPVEPSELEVTVLYVLPRSDAVITNESGFAGNESAVRAANRLEGWEIAVNRTVRAGKPVSREILEMATERAVDEIVMAGRKRTGFTKVLIGSTASDVIQAADQPVVMTG